MTKKFWFVWNRQQQQYRWKVFHGKKKKKKNNKFRDSFFLFSILLAWSIVFESFVTRTTGTFCSFALYLETSTILIRKFAKKEKQKREIIDKHWMRSAELKRKKMPAEKKKAGTSMRIQWARPSQFVLSRWWCGVMKPRTSIRFWVRQPVQPIVCIFWRPFLCSAWKTCRLPQQNTQNFFREWSAVLLRPAEMHLRIYRLKILSSSVALTTEWYNSTCSTFYAVAVGPLPLHRRFLPFRMCTIRLLSLMPDNTAIFMVFSRLFFSLSRFRAHVEFPSVRVRSARNDTSTWKL